MCKLTSVFSRLCHFIRRKECSRSFSGLPRIAPTSKYHTGGERDMLWVCSAPWRARGADFQTERAGLPIYVLLSPTLRLRNCVALHPCCNVSNSCLAVKTASYTQDRQGHGHHYREVGGLRVEWKVLGVLSAACSHQMPAKAAVNPDTASTLLLQNPHNSCVVLEDLRQAECLFGKQSLSKTWRDSWALV